MTGSGKIQYHLFPLLAKIGIKPHGYNVVTAGQVDYRIIEMSDYERVKIIDERPNSIRNVTRHLGNSKIVTERIQR